MEKIEYRDFTSVDMRVGKVVRIEDFPKARRPAYKLWIDFGRLGVKKSSARITKLYKKDELLNRLVIAVVNFSPKQVADFISEVLVLGLIPDSDTVILIGPDRDAPPGTRVL